MKTIATIVLVSSLFFCCTNNSCELVREKVKRIWHDLETTNDTAKAVSMLNDIVSEKSKCVDALIARGDLMYLSEEYNVALSDYKRALLIDKKNVYPLYQLGIVYQELEKYDLSVMYFDSAASLKKIDSNLYMNLKGIAKAESEKGDVDISEIYYRQGISLYYLHKREKAKWCFDFCILNNYEVGHAYWYRGAINAELNRVKEACADFEMAKFNGSGEVESYIDKYCR